jgi:hypothetical protein
MGAMPPIVAAEPSHPQSRAFREFAERVLVRLEQSGRVEGARAGA